MMNVMARRLTPRGTESIARVLVVGSPGLDAEMAWLRGGLAGLEVSWRGAPQAVLEPLPLVGDAVLEKYVATSRSWSTVTPVILPGHDDRSPRKAEGLLLKSFLQAGLTREVVDGIQDLEWREVGFRVGVSRARAYAPPDKVRGPMFHVRVVFSSDVPGPLAVGSGRHRGLGVFAIDDR